MRANTVDASTVGINNTAIATMCCISTMHRVKKWTAMDDNIHGNGLHNMSATAAAENNVHSRLLVSTTRQKCNSTDPISVGTT